MDLAALTSNLQNKSKLRQTFSDTELAEFAQHLCPESVSSGAIVMGHGEPADNMIFILEGSVQILEGERKIAMSSAGDFAGESLFSDTATRNADVQAAEDSIIASFSIHNFNQFLSDNQKLALKFRDFFKSVGAARQAQILGDHYEDQRQYLALIAHNNMKEGLMEFCQIHADKLAQFPLIATGTTGSLLFKKTGLLLTRKVASGPLGGDQAIGTLISTKNICGVIFFRDPLSAHPHHADIEALGRLCDVYQIPFGTNPHSGEAILDYLLAGKGDQPTFANHVLEAYTKGLNKVVEAG